MYERELNEALEALEEFDKSLEEFQPKSNQEELALEKARAQAARLTQQLRKLRDSLTPTSAEDED